MGALRQPRIDSTPARKPPALDTAPRDQYGRDPASPLEQLRAQTDYDADTGYSPMYHAVLADLPRLSSGAVCYAFILTVNRLSFGRGIDKRTGRRYDSTLPVSTAELAEYCRANIRDIQRQVDELSERGMISVNRVGRDRKLVVSLLYRDWRGLEDYAVWKRRQVVAIDSVADEDDSQDEDLLPVSKDAVKLFKAPQTVRPGRATKARKIEVGIRELCVVNESPQVDARIDAVIESGRLVVSTSFAFSEAKGEDKAKDKRHTCRLSDSVEGETEAKTRRRTNDTHVVSPPNEGIRNQVSSLFDPLLQKSGSRLLSPDSQALSSAIAEIGGMPHDFLLHYVMTQRAGRPISGPKVVAAIVKDARVHWEKQSKELEAHRDNAAKQDAAARREHIAMYRKLLANPNGAAAWELDFAREQLIAYGEKV